MAESFRQVPCVPPETRSPALAIGISLVFWLSLFTAAALFGAGTLSPKLVEFWQLRDDQRDQAMRVGTLLERVEQLEREKHALETDPDFVVARARQSLGVAARSETLIVIEPQASAGPEAVAQEATVATTWYEPYVLRIAGDSLLRARLLVASAALVLFGFTFLHTREPAGHA